MPHAVIMSIEVCWTSQDSGIDALIVADTNDYPTCLHYVCSLTMYASALIP